MNNKLMIGAALALVIVVIGGIFFAMQYSGQTLNNAQPASQQTATQPAAVPVEPNSVVIKNFAFNPSQLTVKAGTKVTWMNQDSAPHAIKSDSFNSSTLNQGDTYDYTFTVKGTFNYSCSIHPSMTGTIVVE